MTPLGTPRRAHWASIRWPRPDYGDAVRELEAVHRLDQARLLRDASAIVSESTPLGRLYLRNRRSRRQGDVPASTFVEWREACREEIRAARQDAAVVDRSLLRLAERPFDRWPRGSQLALEALRIDRTQAGRLALARARVGEGAPLRAIEVLRNLLAEAPGEPLLQETLETLALACESAGETHRSLDWYEIAVISPGSDLAVVVSLLALALRCGDVRGIDLASRRLDAVDLSVHGTRRRFRSALRLAQERADHEARGSRGLGTGSDGERIRQMAVAGRGACAEVARALLGPAT